MIDARLIVLAFTVIAGLYTLVFFQKIERRDDFAAECFKDNGLLVLSVDKYVCIKKSAVLGVAK